MTTFFSGRGEKYPMHSYMKRSCVVTQVRHLKLTAMEAIPTKVTERKKRERLLAAMKDISRARYNSKVKNCRNLKFWNERKFGELVDVYFIRRGEWVRTLTGTSKGKGFKRGVLETWFCPVVGWTTHGQHNRLRAPDLLVLLIHLQE